MKTFVVINPELVYCPGGKQRTCTLEEVPAQLEGYSGSVTFAVVPTNLGRVVATERTLDAVMPHQFPGNNSFRAEALDANTYQVFVVPDDLLDRLRSMARQVAVVPYPAAVRHVVNSLQTSEAHSLREKTRVFIKSITAEKAKGAAGPAERVVVDGLGEDLLITAMRGQEILVVRHVRGGEPAIELQRTLAAHRIENPVILTKDEDLTLEFKSLGYPADLVDVEGDLIGEDGIDKVFALRFLSEVEIARDRARQDRRKGRAVLGGSLLLLLIAGSVFAFSRGELAKLEAAHRRLSYSRTIRAGELAVLYQKRYASLARRDSVQIQEELFDLLLALPPQVNWISLEKSSANGLVAVVERQPGAAPFSRTDLTSALASSPFLAKAKIKEEYTGHAVRYTLTVPATPKPGLP